MSREVSSPFFRRPASLASDGRRFPWSAAVAPEVGAVSSSSNREEIAAACVKKHGTVSLLQVSPWKV